MTNQRAVTKVGSSHRKQKGREHETSGDKLFLAMTGHGIDSTHEFGAFTVVGGTGRFEEATGSYEQIITFAVPLGTANVIPYTDLLTGSIFFGSN